MQFAQLLLTDRRRSADKQVLPALRLGEGDDVANLIDASHQRHHAVDAEGDAAMRRRAVFQRVEQAAELLLLSLFADAKRLEHCGLALGSVDAHRSAADFPTV